MNLELLPNLRALHEVQLVADEELIVTVHRPTNSSYSALELFSLDGGGLLYWRWSTKPLLPKNSMADVFPAAIGSIQLSVPGYGTGPQQSVPTPPVLRIVSAGAPLIALIRR